MKEELIQLVEQRPGLWTTNRNFYRDKMGKENDWQAVRDELKVSHITDK